MAMDGDKSRILPRSVRDRHVRPCNLKLQQRDLTLVLRRSVEPGTHLGHQ